MLFFSCEKIIKFSGWFALATIKSILVNQIARWRSVIGHSGEHISAAPESSGHVLYTTCLVMSGDVRSTKQTQTDMNDQQLQKCLELLHKVVTGDTVSNVS